MRDKKLAFITMCHSKAKLIMINDTGKCKKKMSKKI